MVFVFVDIQHEKYEEVLQKLRNKKYNISTANKKLNEIYLNLKGTNEKSTEFREIQECIRKIRGVKEVKIIRRHLEAQNTKLKESLATNNCRFIFDIDSTITRGDPGTIHPSIPEIFQKMEDKGIWVYIATGRSLHDLTKILKEIPVQKSSIAENGGIILGFGEEGYLEFGKKDEPNKILTYLKKKYKVKEDMKQGERITEVIFLQKDVPLEMITEAQKATKASVSVHASKESHHISKKGIDKGSAILELGKRLKWGNSFKISVGDSQLDVPMFEASDYSYAPKNGDSYAKESCSEVLDGTYEKAIEKLYDLIEKSS